MARLAPGQVRAVVLVGSKAGVRRDDEARDRALSLLAKEGFDLAWQSLWLPLFGPDCPLSVIERAHTLGKDLSKEWLVRGVRAFFDRPDLSDFARAWTGKIEAISGEHDRSPSPETSESVTRSALDGRFHLVRDCGHYVNLERPAAFDSLLHRFLQKAGAL
jgi:pimeloyl-ACP methyl ester carboxylesterase